MFSNLRLLGLFILAIFVMAATTDDPFLRNNFCSLGVCFKSPNYEFWNQLFHGLATGTVISVLFFWLLVEFPRHRKRERLKRVFEAQYRSFKLQCIDVFLVLSKAPTDSGTATTLLSQERFREFFKVDTGDGQNRWHRVLNGLNDYYLDALARKMENLRDELRLFLLAVEAEDKDLILYLKDFAEGTHYSINRSNDYDEVKSLGGFFWSLFTGWSLIDGYCDEDVFLEAVKRI